ncbi:hypothetical protein [Agromyces protaetiae]|nr:hypothetical protein [Agromyces protaetiae]
MTDSTPEERTNADEADRDLEVELAPEEELLKGFLPEATPTDGPAPAP